MKTRYILAPIVMLVMLVALSTPAMAGNLMDLETRCWGDNCLKGTITNGSVIVLCNMTDLPDIHNWTITLPQGDVVIAYMHWHRWGACHDNPTAEFWNSTDAYESIYFPYPDEDPVVYEDHGVWFTDYSPRNGNHHYYWKVNATPGDNIFKATGCSGSVGSEHSDGWWFIAVMDNVTNEADRTHTGHWWHNTGYRKTNSHTDKTQTWFYNVTGDPINTDANYTLWVAQSHYGGSHPPIKFNDVEVGTVGSDCPCHGDGAYTDYSLCGWNVNVEADGNQKLSWEYDNDPYYVNFGTLAEKIPTGESKLDPIDIGLPAMMRPNTAYTITATIKNNGDVASGAGEPATLYANDIQKGTATIPSLAPGGTADITFTPDVTLGEGCYEFKVVVDSCSNEKSEHHQVGNVIVVESDSEFETLDLATCVGGTCYIEDLTITNCAGNGITIQDTTVPFVISNCTVHNCNWLGSSSEAAGILLNRVRNGKIEGCRNTIANNTNAGIRVRNSTYVDITDNYIYNNSLYGIYAYPRTLPTTPETRDDCKYINVTGNTIIDHAEAVDLIAYNCTVNGNTIGNDTKTDTVYGIYLMSNYSNVYNNTIENFSGYGMKLFNSSDNCIYGNTFTDNNLSYPEHQAYDMWKGQSELARNHWNSTVELCYYNDTSVCCTNYIGNNWSDYAGSDDDNDKIGDAPYNIDGATDAKDNSPLMEPWVNYALAECGDVDDDNIPGTMSDARAIIRYDIGTCEWAADVDCDRAVAMSDARAIIRYDLNCCGPCG